MHMHMHTTTACALHMHMHMHMCMHVFVDAVLCSKRRVGESSDIRQARYNLNRMAAAADEREAAGEAAEYGTRAVEAISVLQKHRRMPPSARTPD